MAIKANKEITEFVYKLCNGLRKKEDICEYLLRHHEEFYDITLTEKSVNYHLSKLEQQGLIHIKYNGRIIDLER